MWQAVSLCPTHFVVIRNLFYFTDLCGDGTGYYSSNTQFADFMILARMLRNSACSLKWNLLGKKATGGPPTSFTICSEAAERWSSWMNCRGHLWTDSEEPADSCKLCWPCSHLVCTVRHTCGRHAGIDMGLYTTASHAACHQRNTVPRTWCHMFNDSWAKPHLLPSPVF